MTSPLRIELARYAIHRVDDVKPGKGRRVEIVPEIKANGADGCLVMHSESDGVGDVVKVALGIGRLVHADTGVLLSPGQKVVQHVIWLGEHIPHVMKKCKADVVSNE